MVLGKVVSYDPHIVGSVLHNVPFVDIALGPPPLTNNVHNLALDIHLFEHRVVGMKYVAVMHVELVEIRVCGSSSNCCIFSHLCMGSGTLGYY